MPYDVIEDSESFIIRVYNNRDGAILNIACFVDGHFHSEINFSKREVKAILDLMKGELERDG
jgi:hypothetical protein